MPNADDSPRAGYSIVVEMENATTIRWEEVGRMLRALADEISLAAGGRSAPQVIFAHPGPEDESAELISAVRKEVPRLAEVARLHAVGVPGGRYYELKNAGVAIADGEVTVFLDADSVPEPGWLRALLAPFRRPEVVVVSGHTYLGYCGLVSRTLALIWFFPLRDHDDRDANRRALNSNNCAFRTKCLRETPFPIDNGFKVSCTKLMNRLGEAGIQLVRVPAYVQHAPLQGWRFLCWRAWVTGRDADRKFAELKSPSRLRRLAAALKFWVKMELRAIRRVLVHHRHVAMPAWQVLAALLLGCSFYSIALVGQLVRLSGLASDRPEHVPSFAENH